MEVYTPDQRAIVDLMPDAESIVLLCGFSGHGYKLAPSFGDVPADLVLGGRTLRAIDNLAPPRFEQMWH